MALELCVISNCRVNSEKGIDFEKGIFECPLSSISSPQTL